MTQMSHLARTCLRDAISDSAPSLGAMLHSSVDPFAGRTQAAALAIQSLSRQQLEEALRSGADVNALNDADDCLLSLAVRRSFLPGCVMLLDAGASLAPFDAREDNVRLLVDLIVFAARADDVTLAARLADCGHGEVVRAIVDEIVNTYGDDTVRRLHVPTPEKLVAWLASVSAREAIEDVMASQAQGSAA